MNIVPSRYGNVQLGVFFCYGKSQTRNNNVVGATLVVAQLAGASMQNEIHLQKPRYSGTLSLSIFDSS